MQSDVSNLYFVKTAVVSVSVLRHYQNGANPVFLKVKIPVV